MTNELIVRFINEVCRSRIIKPRVSVCVPAAITGIEADAVVEAVMAAGHGRFSLWMSLSPPPLAQGWISANPWAAW